MRSEISCASSPLISVEFCHSSGSCRVVETTYSNVREVIAKIERGDLPRNDGAVMLQGYRVLKDVIELARKIEATEKLTEQINALRRRVDGQRGAER